MSLNVQHTVGPEKVSVTVTRKTHDDLLVSQHSSERWFKSAGAADAAQRRLLGIFVESETTLIDGEDELQLRREQGNGGAA